MWPEWSERLLPDLRQTAAARTALSCATLVAGSRVKPVAAARLLGEVITPNALNSRLWVLCRAVDLCRTHPAQRLPRCLWCPHRLSATAPPRVLRAATRTLLAADQCARPATVHERAAPPQARWPTWSRKWAELQH